MISWIPIALDITSKALDLIGYKMTTKWINEVATIQEQIIREEAKGFNADDAKLGVLYKKIKIAMEAAHAEIVAAYSTRK